MMNYLSRAAILSFIFSLAACGGSGSTGTIPSPQQTTNPGPPQQSNNANFVIVIPAGSSTQSVTAAIGSTVLATANVSAGASICSPASDGARSCKIGAVAPLGNDTFTITAYDQPNGKGNVLASGTVAANVSSSSSITTIDVAVTGRIAKITVALANPYPPVGTAASTNVIVTGLDADGNTVLGAFATPVALQDFDASGATKLSATTVAGSSSTVTLSYDGALPFTSATITASLSGTPAVSATFAPTPAFLKSYNVPPVMVGPFPEGPAPWDMTLGPDGNMWAVANSVSEVIKITHDGKMTSYPLAQSYWELEGIVVGSDGNLWFAENQNNAIGKITTAGTITSYTLPQSIALPACVALGKDGNVWFADQYNDVFGSITPRGTIAEYPLPSNSFVNNITTGADGNLWMSDEGNNAIIKASTSGAILASYPIPTNNAQPYGLAAGPDGNVWFAEFYSGKIGRVTPSGTMSEFALPTGAAGPISITPGPDGRMWFAEMGPEAGLGKTGYISIDGSHVRDFLGNGYHVHSLAFDRNAVLWYTGLQMPVGGQEIGTFAY